MPEKSTNHHALELYKAALQLFGKGYFAKAHLAINRYRECVRYDALKKIDSRSAASKIQASVIIVSRNRETELCECVDTLKSQIGPPFEIIVVDNGSNRPLSRLAMDYNLLFIECPIPFTPAEGRNIGAYFSKSSVLIFLDDDALAENDFVQSAVSAFDHFPFIGIRGRIIPKTSAKNSNLAGVYDLGRYPIPALLDVEGNMAVPKKIFQEVGGMNPLLFGAEGLDFTARLIRNRPEGKVFYWPNMIIKHDYASGKNLHAKRLRQALSKEYFKIMFPGTLKVKEHYAHLNATYQNPVHRVFPKKISTRISNRWKELVLTKKSEGMLFDKFQHSPDNTSLTFSEIMKDCRTLDQKEIENGTHRVAELELELEDTRSSIDYRLGQLILETFSSPLENIPQLPFRLFRLLKYRKQQASE
jgi:glycosyltransferase involved in cell wall biosynthesis